ncbi:MAG: hypothetical protein ICV77_08655 [Cyanobacteria bacterium Co-bin8]|nr:hypothetical protein [Cyanobacteria bacterium Co-bin8]
MTAVIPLNSRTILGLNQEAYQQLRLALSLNLRRQLLIAVCDDAALQNELATRLEADLNGSANGTSEDNGPNLPAVVNLWLDRQNLDLARQAVLWCKQQGLTHPSLVKSLPTFQMLGIDQLTRYSPALQNRFLASLTHLEPLLSRLEVRLVLWVSRPWLRKIRQSVPQVWQLRNGLFEFAGDPTPLYPVEAIGPAVANKSRPQPPVLAPAPTPAQADALETQAIDFWTVLTEDLSALEAPSAPPASQRNETVSVTGSTDALTGAVQPPPAAIPSLLIPFAQNSARSEPKTPKSEVLEFETLELKIPEPSAPEPKAPKSEVLDPATLEQATLKPVTPKPVTPRTPAAVPPPNGAASPLAPPAPDPVIPDAHLLALWQHIQSLAQQQAGPLTLARAYLFLGQTCRDRIEAGNHHPDLIDLALEAYTRALPNLKPGSPEWGDGLNDLGSLYWLRSHREPHPEGIIHWLQQSIQAYRAVLGYPQPPSEEGLARLHSNLGTVYSLLANLQDPTQNLEQSARAYHRALQYRPADTFPTEYAVLQNSLGAIHWRLAQQSDTRNHLHRAITAYSEALRYRSPQASPQEYAMIQNNLGIAYWSLAQHERPVFLLGQAVAAYRSALAYRTLSTDPAGCAATHNNLGTAYWDLAQHQDKHPEGQRTLWQQALSAYETALTAAQRALGEAPDTPLSFDLWATFHSAGVVHDQLAQHLPEAHFDLRAKHLDQALLHYLTALDGWRALPDRLDLLTNALIHNIRLQFQIRGVEGQNAVLSRIPAELLPDILPQL